MRLARVVTGVTEVHGIVRERLGGRPKRGPERLDGQQLVQQNFQVVRSGDGQARFLHPGLEVLLRTLLGVEADAASERPFATAGQIHGREEVFLGLGHPLTRAGLHT